VRLHPVPVDVALPVRLPGPPLDLLVRLARMAASLARPAAAMSESPPPPTSSRLTRESSPRWWPRRGVRNPDGAYELRIRTDRSLGTVTLLPVGFRNSDMAPELQIRSSRQWRVHRRDRLGGLLHEYHRQAA
jgi:hypothetical protein